MAAKTDAYVLACTYLSGPLEGKPQYFAAWTVIGPMATPDLGAAAVFASPQAAMQSPAYSHWSSSYEPKRISDCEQADGR
jgi:hypothetical protein